MSWKGFERDTTKMQAANITALANLLWLQDKEQSNEEQEEEEEGLKANEKIFKENKQKKIKKKKNDDDGRKEKKEKERWKINWGIKCMKENKMQ